MSNATTNSFHNHGQGASWTRSFVVGGARLLLASCVLASFFCGCNQGPSNTEKGIATQTLHVGNGLEPQELDPQIITGGSEIKILSSLFEGLAGQHPMDLSPLPGSAESWEISEDGLEYIFHLRDGLRWSNGDILSAQDFAFSFQRMLNRKLGAANAYLLFALKNAQAYYEGSVSWESVGVTPIDESTLKLELENPTPYFLRLLSHPAWFPLHKPSLAAFGDPLGRASGWTRPGSLVSNGPFQLADWKINEYIRVVKNENYWDRQSTRLNEIIFYPTESRDAEGRAFEAGQLHITEAVPSSKVGYYREQKNPALNIDQYLGTYYLQLNTRKPPLSDSRVRKALSLVIDRRLIVEQITQGDQQPAWYFTPPGMDGYDPKISGEIDRARARKLLSEAGFPNGEGFPVLTYLYNTSENNKTIGEALQQTWQSSLGIRVELINQEWKVFTQSRQSGEFDILRGSWIADYIDPSSFLEVWTSQSGNNFTGWSSGKYDNLISRSLATRDQSKRFSHFANAERLLIDEQPIIPLYFYTSVYLKDPSVQGYNPTLLNYHPWKHVYLESATE